LPDARFTHGRRKRLRRLGSDYDIREIDEELYLEVLARRRAEDDCAAGDLTGSSRPPQTTATDRNRQEIR